MNPTKLRFVLAATAAAVAVVLGAGVDPAVAHKEAHTAEQLKACTAFDPPDYLTSDVSCRSCCARVKRSGCKAHTGLLQSARFGNSLAFDRPDWRQGNQRT